ncbi:MAG: DUF1015 domain-containing protein [Roseburia sp.]|nr:DUF1015 domain-containing protein [Roseburia sp.]
MAEIRPFRAYRPAPGREAEIAALPYDVYNREEACAEVQKHPNSFLAIDRAETQFSPETDMYAPQVYRKARELLEEWIAEGKFIQEEIPCYYLYEQVMNGRSQTGIVACASIDDYCNQVIKKHENTRADKEQDRINHVDICNMQTGPIFLAYRENIVLRAAIEEGKRQTPACEFVSEDSISHRVWVLSNQSMIAEIREAFKKIAAIYIADGHHRCASAVKVGLKRRRENPGYTGEEEYNYFLSVLFPEDELHIMDYNRIVTDLNGWSRDAFLTKLSESFEVALEGTQPYVPERKGCFGMYLHHEWYSLKIKKELLSTDVVAGLDVSVLQEHLLGPVLGIADPKTDKRIDFVGGIRGLKELERRCGELPQDAVAFSLYPTSIQELFAVADEGRLMPPKSTWFEPKLRSGLFLHDIGGPSHGAQK